MTGKPDRMVATEKGTRTVGSEKVARMVSVQADSLDSVGHFKMLTASVVPRPIAWTSTLSRASVPNLAPFSFYTVVSTTPPMVALTLERASSGGFKDTQRNIEETGEFVVNVVSSDLAEQMSRTSAESAADIDEFQLAGVEPAPSLHLKAPRVAAARISMECTLHSVLRPGSDSVLIGRIEIFHIAEDLITPYGHIDIDGLEVIGRVDSRYIRVQSAFRLP
ncbi:flavin reductase family protein [Streptomyces werraensis]|uniref:flavin reductase family protein n=1 Tax=Streptomyces werraensis TaxID=68284 RepID=UPI0037F2DC8E